MARGYRFDREAQDIYTSRDLLEFVPRRQWPEIQLPAPQVVAQPDVPMPGNFPDLQFCGQGTRDTSSRSNLILDLLVDIFNFTDAAKMLL